MVANATSARWTSMFRRHGRSVDMASCPAAAPATVGWFALLLRDRLRKSRRPVALENASNLDEQGERLIVNAARRAALAGSLFSAGSQVGELMTAVTDGLVAPLTVPAMFASAAAQAAYCTGVHVDLACDLASLYGVPFDVDDTAELATVFHLALGHSEALVSDDEVLLGRIGKALVREAMFGLVPFFGVPCSAVHNYRATRRLALQALGYVKQRRVEAARRALPVLAARDLAIGPSCAAAA